MLRHGAMHNRAGRLLRIPKKLKNDKSYHIAKFACNLDFFGRWAVIKQASSQLSMTVLLFTKPS